VPAELLPRLRRARDHVDRHYQAGLDLDTLAAFAGVSKYHFARSFEAVYGETRSAISPGAGSSAPRTCCGRPT
jgi:AraC-like DNA-binding protein